MVERISKEELAEARRIADMEVDELLAAMTPEQKDRLRASVIGDFDDVDIEEEPTPQVDSRVTQWLHEFGQAEFQRGRTAGRSQANRALQRRMDNLHSRIARIQKTNDEDRKEWERDSAKLQELHNWAQRNASAASDRDEYASRLQVIAELCNRPINDPIGDRVEDLDVFAQRMRRFAKEYIVREGLVGPNPEKMADALVQYVTGRKPGDVVA